MANCPNCKTKMSCGCQKRTAKDGKVVCSTCVNAYNQKLTVNQKPIPGNSMANIGRQK